MFLQIQPKRSRAFGKKKKKGMNSSFKTKTNTHYNRYIYLYKLLKRIHRVDFKNRNNLIWKNDWTLETYPIEASNEKIWSKNSIKIDGQNHHMEDKKEKREREGKVKRCATHKNQRKERASPSQDRKLSHPQPLMLLACK